MKAKLLIVLIFCSNLLFADNTKAFDSLLTPSEVNNSKESILKEAIAMKNYKDVTTIAISFYLSSVNKNYIGNRKALKKNSLELLELSHDNKQIEASVFLMLNTMKENPLFAREIAKEAIQDNQSEPSPEYLLQSITLVTSFVSLTLNTMPSDTKELNFSLGALESLRIESNQINLFRALIFKNLHSYELADLYLNKACSNPKAKQIIEFCKHQIRK